MFAGLSANCAARACCGLDAEISNILDLPVNTNRLFSGVPRFEAHAGLFDVWHGIQVALRVLAALGRRPDGPESLNARDANAHFLAMSHLFLDVFRLAEQCNVLNLCGALVSLYGVLTDRTFLVSHSLDSFVLSAVSLFVPAPLFEILKRMSVFSSSKPLDDLTFLSDLLSQVFEFLHKLVSYIPCDKMRKIFVSVLDNIPLGKHHSQITKMRKCLFKWAKDKTLLMSETFRKECDDLEPALQDSVILDWSRRSTSVAAVLSDFRHMLRSLAAYRNTTRVEPCCFVFQGPPKTFKSTVLGQVIKVLGLTTYAHTVKASSDGKDFYDTYNCEDVFMMDDVGQQGISQFRNLINWVSCIKYPLECASAPLKDTKFFCSPLIMFTTNRFDTLQGLVRTDGIDNLPALWRRGMVFDFVEREGVKIIQFKWFDPEREVWLETFPEDFTLKCPTFVSRHLRRQDVLAWLVAVITEFRRVRDVYSGLNELSKDEIDEIKGLAAGYSTSSSEEFHDAAEFVSHDLFPDYMTELAEWAAFRLGQVCGNLWNYKECVISLAVLGLLYALVSRRTSSNLIAHSADMLRDKVRGRTSEPTSTQSRALLDSMYLCKNESTGAITSCLVSGHCVVLPSHFVPQSEALYLSVLHPKDPTNKLWDNLPATIVFRQDSEDVVVCAVPLSIPTPFPNRHKLFTACKLSSSLITPFGCIDVGSVAKRVSNVVYVDKQHDVTRTAVSAIMYDFSFESLCGSLLCGQQGGVLGMHVVGAADETAGGAILWSDQTRAALQNILLRDNKFFLDLKIKDAVPGASVMKMDLNLHSSVPKHTRLAPSLMYDVFPVEKRPANLIATGLCTVKDIAKKSFIPVACVNARDISFAQDWLRSVLRKFPLASEREIVLGDEWIARVNKDSTNGFGCDKGKLEYLDYDRGAFTPKGAKLFADCVAAVRRGEFVWQDHIYVETLKDELRVEAKVNAPRSFRFSPLQSQLLTKYVFFHFVKHTLQNRSSNDIMVGCNPLKDFDEMAKIISGHVVKGALDFGKFDGKMLPQVQHAFADVVAEYSEDYFLADFVLRNMPHTLVSVMDNTFMTTHSMPSGHWLTAIVNSYINRMLTAMWYSSACRSVGKSPSLLEFRSIRDFVYGDDKVVAHSLTHLPLTLIHMRDYFEGLGLDVTTATKQRVVEPTEQLEDLEFLKRKFVYSPQFRKFLCPLSRVTLQNSMMWFDTSKDEMVVLEGKLNAFQREAFLHGRLYDELMQPVLERCRALRLTPRWLSADELSYLVQKNDPYYVMSHQFVTDADSMNLCQVALPDIEAESPSVKEQRGKENNATLFAHSGITDNDNENTSMTSMKPSNDVVQGDPELSVQKSSKSSSVRTRPLDELNSRYTAQVPSTSVDARVRMDYSGMIGKPFHVSVIPWTTAHARYAELASISFPSVLSTLTRVSSAFLDLSCLYRVRGCVMVQVSGTPNHQGCVLASVVPFGVPAFGAREFIHSGQSAPHEYLLANMQTSACIEIPFFSGTKMRWTHSVNDGQHETFTGPFASDDYAALRLQVLNPLFAPSSGSTSIPISISVMFTEIECYAPKPDLTTSLVAHSMAGVATRAIDGVFSLGRKVTSDLFDASRSWIKTYTGLHNPNEPVPAIRTVTALRNNPNYTDSNVFYHKMDPYTHFQQVASQPYGETDEDENLIANIIKKPMFITSVPMATGTAAGAIVFTAPISPLMFRHASGVNTSYVSAPIEKIARMARFFRGSLDLTIQNVGSSFHMYKLLVVREYYSSTEMANGVTPMAKALNLPSDILEFSAGGQQHTVNLPMSSLFDYVPMSSDPRTQGMVHGRVVVYLLQPVVANGSVSTTLEVNFHLSAGSDFCFYGYATDKLVAQTSAFPVAVQVASGDFIDFPVASSIVGAKERYKLGESILFETEDAAKFFVDYYHGKKGEFTRDKKKVKLNAPVSGKTLVAHSGAASSSVTPFNLVENTELRDHKAPLFNPLSDAFRPLVHVRDLVRKLNHVTSFSFDSAEQEANISTHTFKLSSLLLRGLRNPQRMLNPQGIIGSMFQGYRGGIRLKIVIVGAKQVVAHYLPPTPVVVDVGGVEGKFRLKSSSELTVDPATQTALDRSFSAFVGNSTTPNAITYCGPMLECQDFKDNSSPMDIASPFSAAPDPTDTNNGSVIVECEIPYMNVCRWVSNMNAFYESSFLDDYYLASLGNLELGVRSSFSQDRDGSWVKRPYAMHFYVGCSDDGRFFNQNFSVPCLLPTVTNGVLYTSFQGIDYTVPSTIGVNALAYYGGDQ
jgi:hypothetical protein